jgi:purine-nucleoside phosphorylase
MLDLAEQVEAAVARIRDTWPEGRPKVGMILGTGLGSLADEIDQEAVIDYGEIPHFPKSTSLSHKGQFVCGMLEGVHVVAMEGRFHMYEGYPLKQVTLPVRVMKSLGANILLVSNACGGLNPYYQLGDIMVIDDHINLLGDNPLIGINDDNLGPRFPDMSQPYDFKLIELTQEVARSQNLPLHRGVFAAVSGPNLETRAEYRFLRRIGADVVGMSTVPEVIVAVHAGMRSIGFSVITDMCFPDALEPADPLEIVRVAKEAEPKLRALVRGVLAKLG